MIRVAICDDDKHMQESLSKYLLDYSIQCDREIDHAEFDTCEELMDEYYNVPLVKTQMKKIIVTAKTLYSHPKNVSKIYAALHTDLAW